MPQGADDSRSPPRREPSEDRGRPRRSPPPPAREERDRSRSRSRGRRDRSRSPAKEARRRSPSRSRSRDRGDRDRPRRSRSPAYDRDRRRSRSPRRHSRSPPRRRFSSPPRPGCQLFVAGFSFMCNEKDVIRKFGRYGEVRDVRLVRGPNGESRGFGFVDMMTEDDAKAAIRSLDQADWNGRRLLVEIAKRPRTF